MAAELNKEKFEIMMETALNRFNLNQYDETVCDIEGTYSIEGNKITIEYSSNIYGREWAKCYNMPEDFGDCDSEERIISEWLDDMESYTGDVLDEAYWEEYDRAD